MRTRTRESPSRPTASAGRPDTFVPTAQASEYQPLADEAGHTLFPERRAMGLDDGGVMPSSSISSDLSSAELRRLAMVKRDGQV